MVTQMTKWSIIMLVATDMLQPCITNTTPEAFGMPSCPHCINNPPKNRLLASATAAAPLLHFRRQRLPFVVEQPRRPLRRHRRRTMEQLVVVLELNFSSLVFQPLRLS